MEEIDALFQRLNEGNDIGEIRNDIADLISQCLQQMQGALDYWEKLYFAHAIAALGWNKVPGAQPTPVWLRLCLVDLEKAFVPAEQRDEDHVPKDDQIEALTFEQLMEMLNMAR
jgi:hypothetical protein